MSDKEINKKDIIKALQESDLPADLKKKLLEELPNLLEYVGDAAKTVYDPNAIWLEAIQYADYMSQHINHLEEKHISECAKDSVETMRDMTNGFKQMAENAMRVLDTLKIESELVDWTSVKITYGKDDDAQR